MTTLTWSTPVPNDVAQRRAGGRWHYNAWRRFIAARRRARLVDLVVQRGLNPWRHGARAELARLLKVSRATITRDLRALRDEATAGRSCPLCGCGVGHVTIGQHQPDGTE